MTKQEVERIFAYHRWANARMLDAVAALSPEQQQRDLKSSFPSVHATLVHMLSADWIWLQRWQGTSPTTFPETAAMTDLAVLRSRWAGLEREQAAVVTAQTDESLRRPLAYRNLKGESLSYPLGDVMQHLVNHGSYHRGQVTTMVRQLGGSIQSTDFVTFLGI